MTWRFISPNKPIRAAEEFLDEVDENHIVDAKLDGWRLEIVKVGGIIKTVSRNNTPIEIPQQLIKALSNMPDGTALDAEWINTTRMKALNSEFGCKLPLIDNIIVFDVKWYDGKFLGKMPLVIRRQIEYYQSLSTATINDILNNNMRVFSAIAVDGTEAKKFYLEQQCSILSEGVVVKRKRGVLNGNWYKVKYRK